MEYDRKLVFSPPRKRTNHPPGRCGSAGDARSRRAQNTIARSRKKSGNSFDKVIEQINEGETVIFDITHGLRSIPFLAFLFAAFLKTAKQVTIEAIYYGALELGDRDKGIPAPVIDLSEYVAMLDWITATDQFGTHGNATIWQLLDRGAMLKKLPAWAAEQLRIVSPGSFLCQP